MTSNKPSIFIDLGESNFSEAQVKQAIEKQFNVTDLTVILRPSHNESKLHCTVSFPEQTTADMLLNQDTPLVIGDSSFKIEAYNTLYPNVYLVNKENFLSQEEIRVFMKNLVGDIQHNVYYGEGQISLFIGDETLASKMIGPQIIKGREFVFEKHISNIRSKNIKSHLFLRFEETPFSKIQPELPAIKEFIEQTYGKLVDFERKGENQLPTVMSLIFTNSNNAQAFFDSFKENSNTLLNYKNVTVSWKRSDSNDVDKRTVVFKKLKTTVTEQEIRDAVKSLKNMNVESVEFLRTPLRTSGPFQIPSKAAFVILSSREDSEKLQLDSILHKEIKNLFVGDICISPHLGKDFVDFKNVQVQSLSLSLSFLLVSSLLIYVTLYIHSYLIIVCMYVLPSQKQQMLPFLKKQEELNSHQQQQAQQYQQNRPQQSYNNNQYYQQQQHQTMQQYYQSAQYQQQQQIMYQQYMQQQQQQFEMQMRQQGITDPNQLYIQQQQQGAAFYQYQKYNQYPNYPNNVYPSNGHRNNNNPNKQSRNGPKTQNNHNNQGNYNQAGHQNQQQLQYLQKPQQQQQQHQPKQNNPAPVVVPAAGEVQKQPQVQAQKPLVTKEELSQKFKSTNDVTLINEALHQVTSAAIAAHFQGHSDKLSQILDVFQDTENLSYTEQIDLIYNEAELKERIDESIKLIEEQQ